MRSSYSLKFLIVILVTVWLSTLFTALAAAPSEALSPLILVVDSNLDDADAVPGDGLCSTSGGLCTLRAALEEANASPNTLGIDEIHFNLPNSGTKPYEIKRNTNLPFITDPLVIDGTTQPGYAGAPLITLQGVLRDEDGLTLTAGNTTIRGLKLVSFHLNGIYITSNDNIIQGNYIGTDGASALGNLKDGVRIENASNNLIGGTTAGAGNVIDGNSNTSGSGNVGSGGIYIFGTTSTNNTIQGNIIGLLPDGAYPAGNRRGIYIYDSPNNMIGGTIAAARNIISGNNSDGISISGVNAINNVIQGNYIGTDSSGTLARGNNGDGIFLYGDLSSITIGGTVGVTPGGSCTGACNVISANHSGAGISSDFGVAQNITIRGNYIGTDVTGTVSLGQQQEGLKLIEMRDSTIGGDTAGAGNLISGNTKEGITLWYGGNNVVKGNLIGTDITGTLDRGNVRDGIAITGASAANYRIENNTISGNDYRGIKIESGAHDVVIVGNRIGTSLNGTQPLGNTMEGILIYDQTNHVLIGGTNSSDKNVIAYNSVGIARWDLVNITILGNSIFSNTGLGISGAEYSYSFRIDDVRVTSNTVVEGLFTSTPNPNQIFRLEFFANSVCDSSGTGEGETFLYSTSVTTDSGGAAPFSVTIPGAIAASQLITITATANDGAGGTTQFSRCAAVIEADVAITKTADFLTRNEGSPLTYTLTVMNNGPDLATNIQVNDLLPSSVTYSGDDGGGSYNPTTGLWTISSLAKNASRSLTIHVTVNSGTLNSSITNSASITQLDQKDPYSNNQTAAVNVGVGANIGVLMSADTVYPLPGNTVTFTIDANNLGPGGVTGLHLNDLLPAGLSFVSADATQGTYTEGTGDWLVGTLAKNASATLTLTASVNNGIPNQIIQNTVSVSQSDYTDPVSSNNTASLILAVGGSDLAVSKTVDHSTPDEGDPIVYTVTAQNIGPNNVTGVNVNDLLPTGLTFSNATTSAGSYDSSSGVWTVGSLNVDGSATLQISAIVNGGTAGSGITNSATIASTTSNDNNPANNQAQRLINVRPAFVCSNIRLSNISLSGGSISWTVINNNPQSTLLTGSYIVWNSPDLAAIPGLGMVSQTLGPAVYWTGSDSSSPTDSSNAAEGTFNMAANRTIAGSSSLLGGASFSNLPASMAYYITPWDLSGTVLYFDHPRQVSDCAVPLTLPTRPPVYTVSKTADTNDGVCDADCSLREAVVAANTHPGATIVLSAGTYTLTLSGANENFGATGDLDLRASMTIIGAAAASTIINGNGIDRVFDTPASGVYPKILIKNLTIEGGSAQWGGGLYNTLSATTTLLNTIVTGNAATWTYQRLLGGGIRNEQSTLTIVTSEIYGNQLLQMSTIGGGIATYLGTLTIVNSSIHDNVGGGIGADGLSSSIHPAINLTGSTIYNNTGDGINNSYAFMTVTNSTISGNTLAGIMHTNNGSGSITLNQATITNNANAGLYNFGPFGDFYLRDSIIAGNTSGGVSQDCVSVKAVSQGYNLIGNSSGCTFPAGMSHDLLDVNPLLGSLANNGGVTLTHALQAGSPAIDAIPLAQCGASSDQRGIKRPQITGCDIGAYEVQGVSNNPMVFAVNSFVDTGDGKISENETTAVHILQLQVFFSAAMADPAGDTASNDVTNPLNYRLVNAGADNTFQTSTCAAVSGDDGVIAVNSAYYSASGYYVTLDINAMQSLPAGKYRLLVCSSLQSTSGAALDGNIDGTGGDAFTRNFTIIALPPTQLVVNSTSDAIDINPGDGLCASEQNECTLRAAIMEANALPGTNSIALPAGTYMLSLLGQNEDAALTGDLDITDSMSIWGQGAAAIIIDGGGIDRVFHIMGAFTVTFSNFTINNGALSGGQGGGIFNVGGVLSLSEVILSNNQAGTGGGLRNSLGGKATLTNTIVYNNSSELQGGGIYNDADSQLDIINSLLLGNIAVTKGGGVYSQNSFLNITNSTLSGNITTQGDGGAIFATGNRPTNIRFSTFVANQAQNYGGAFAIGNTADVFNITGTIMAQNKAITSSTYTCGASEIHSNGYNIADDYYSCRYVLTNVGDRNQVDPMIGSLGDYGGFTPSYSLLVGSPAIDAVIPASACTVTVDQRGVGRPKNAYCDIGSFETVPLPALNAPDGLVLSDILPDSITLNWVDHSSDEDAFAIERSSDGINWQEIDRVNSNITTYSDVAVVCDATYSYRVRAYRLLDGGYSAYSAVAAATTPICVTVDLSLTMTSSIAIVPQGNTVDYTLTVTSGGVDPAPNVQVKDILPSGMIYLSSQASQGQYDAVTGLWKVGQVAANSSVTLVIHARVGSGTYGQTPLNTAEITRASVNDPDSTPNNHNNLEDDWAENSITVACAPASAFNVVDGDVTGLIVAIEAANNAACYPGIDTINLAANGHYLLTTIYSQQTGLPQITENLAINGNYATIERDTGVATPHFRLLYVGGVAAVSLDTITLQSGNPRINTNANDYTQHGGAILNEGTLTVTNATFVSNVSVEGGAIANHNGTLIVMDSTFTLNDSFGYGGAIVSDGATASATVGSSTFDRNTGGQGGALVNLYGQMTITNSTLWRNSSSYLVDGIHTEYGTLNLTHTTIYSDAPGNNVTLYFTSSTIHLRANVIQTPQTKICGGVANLLFSLGYNITNGNSLCGTLAVGDKINTNPHLGTLESYGGATQTINLLGSSPALDAIPTVECTLSLDQRGVSRPQFNGCDSGAFETDSFSLLIPVQLSPQNNTAISGNPPTFSWEPISLADHYELQFGTANPPTAPIIVVGATSYTPDSPLLQMPYYWRVRAVAPNGQVSPWSKVWKFSIISAGNAVPVINVVTTANAILSWSPVSWAAAYEVQVDLDAGFTLPYVEQHEVSASTTIYTTQPLLNGTYYWRVRAKKADGTWGSWSSVQPLNIALP